MTTLRFLRRTGSAALTAISMALAASACDSSAADPARSHRGDRPGSGSESSTHSGRGAERFWQRFGPEHPVAVEVEGNGIVAVGRRGELVEYQREESQVAWSAQLDLPNVSARPALSESTVVVSSDDEAIAVDRANGSLRWRVPVRHAVRSTYAKSSAGNVFVIASEGRQLVALDELSGALRWTLAARDDAVLLVGATKETVVFAEGAAPSMILRGVDASTGAPRWERALPGTTFGAALGVDSVVVAGGDATGATLTMLDAASGAQRWTANLADGIPDVTVPAVDRDGVAVLDRRGTVHLFEGHTGRERWAKKVGAANVPAQLFFTKHAVLWPTYAGTLAFDRVTGATHSDPVVVGVLKDLRVLGDTIVELVEVGGASSVELRPA